MSFDRVKPIDQLLDEVAHVSLVVVPDAPLADAINRRLDRPMIGRFADTPRRLATGHRETAEDRIAFLEVIAETDLPWKTAARVVGDVLQCWEYEVDPTAIISYDRYDTTVVEQVLDVVCDIETTSSRLSSYHLDATDEYTDREIAVVGIDQLTPLERSILPDDVTVVDRFEADTFASPPFHIFDSPTEIVETLCDVIGDGHPRNGGYALDDGYTLDDGHTKNDGRTKDDGHTKDDGPPPENIADDVAVVLDSGSEYATLVESAFEAAEIPFYGGPGFTDHASHRTFLRLLRVAFDGSDLRVRDVRPVLEHLGVELDVEHDEKRLSTLDDGSVEWIQSFRRTADSRTFEDALHAFESRCGESLPAFRDELDALGIADETLTEDRIDDLTFYLDSYEIPVDRDNEGVLLADATAAGTVDRRLVFHLGLDDGWTRSSPDRPWVDAEAFHARNLDRFQALLQSGAKQAYLVEDERAGSPVTPCLYLEELLSESVERFSDLRAVEYGKRPQSTAGGFTREPLPIDVPASQIDTVSQSRLNTYVNCPREYLFDRLVDGPDRDYFREGTLFHDVAECYLEHPTEFDDDTVATLVEFMCAEMEPLVRPVDRETQKTRFHVGIRILFAYIDELRADSGGSLPDVPTDGGSTWGTNVVAAFLGLELESARTEQWFEDEDLGVNGVIDLVVSPTHLVDYKTGSQQSARTVVSNAAIDPPSDRPNFQALLYLTYQRSRRPDSELRFSFVHFLEPLEEVIQAAHERLGQQQDGHEQAEPGENEPTEVTDPTLVDSVIPDLDLQEMVTTVRYVPTTVDEYVTSAAAYRHLQDGYADCRGTVDALGYRRYAAVMSDLGFPDEDVQTLRDGPYATQLRERVRQELRSDHPSLDAIDADVEKGCDQLIRRLHGLRAEVFFKPDLDAFETFLDERLGELRTRSAGTERFPLAGPGGEPNYRWVDHRDMLLGE